MLRCSRFFHSSYTKEAKFCRNLQFVMIQAQIRPLQEQLAVEKEVWQENYRKKQDALLMQKERALQQQVKSERDKDIENVMQQLLKENQSAIDECEREAEKRIRCVSTDSITFIFYKDHFNLCLKMNIWSH